MVYLLLYFIIMASNSKITLKGLSKILNLSISTISKSLNDSSEISQLTKDRVKEVAKLYNYQPNRVAVNLKSGKTKTIGVVLPSIQNYFFNNVLNGIEQTIENTGYNILISITNESHKKEKQHLNSLANGLVDGFIISVAEETQQLKDVEHYKNALALKKPIVMFDRVAEAIESNTVIGNDKQAVYEATSYLKTKGKKHIALVTTLQNLNVGKERYEGYKKALEEFSNEAQLEIVLKTTSPTVESDFKSFLTSNPEIDAIIALDEESSLGAHKMTKELNKQIPKDIALIGYANTKIAEHMSPKLSTINQHGFKIGEIAALQLLHQLSQNVTNKRTIVSSEIIHRQTS